MSMTRMIAFGEMCGICQSALTIAKTKQMCTFQKYKELGQFPWVYSTNTASYWGFEYVVSGLKLYGVSKM